MISDGLEIGLGTICMDCPTCVDDGYKEFLGCRRCHDDGWIQLRMPTLESVAATFELNEPGPLPHIDNSWFVIARAT